MLLPAALLSLILLWPAAPVDAQSTGSGSCQEVHLFLARGDDELYPGRIGQIATTVCASFSSCDYEDIVFTSVSGSVYCTSVAQGANNGIAQVIAYNKKCPDALLILGGYSLGAHIVGDVLGGGGGDFYNCAESTVGGNLNPKSAPGNKIAAALQFGDVRYTSGQSYDEGTGAALQGKYPRSGSQLSNLNLFASKLHSYCLITDPICAQGLDGESHTTYMAVYAAEAGAWAVQMVASMGGTLSSSSAPSSTQAPSSTSSAAASSTAVTTSSDSATTSSASSTDSAATASASSTSSGSPTPAAASSAAASSTAAAAAAGTHLTGGAKAGIAVGVIAGVAGAAAGLYALFIILRRRRANATAASGGASGEDADPNQLSPPVGMLERNTSYSRVAAQEHEAAAMAGQGQGLELPQMIHENDRNRESNGTLDPLIRYGDVTDDTLSRHSYDIANERMSGYDERISGYDQYPARHDSLRMEHLG